MFVGRHFLRSPLACPILLNFLHANCARLKSSNMVLYLKGNEGILGLSEEAPIVWEGRGEHRSQLFCIVTRIIQTVTLLLILEVLHDLLVL